MEHLDVHRRALAAWRTLDQETQTRWHEYGNKVEPHKPPFDKKAHISGQNLFVSAYHGFVTLGNEHVPVLQRFVKFPPFDVCLADALKRNGNLVIPAAAIPSAWEASRYRLLDKLLLDVPGKGKHPGRLKNYLADRVCGSGDVSIVVHDYASVWGGAGPGRVPGPCEVCLAGCRHWLPEPGIGVFYLSASHGRDSQS